MSDIIHFIKAGNVNSSSVVGGPDPQYNTLNSNTQAESSGITNIYDNRFPEQYANLVKRDNRFYAGGDSRYLLMSGDAVSDTDALGGHDGNYYLSYTNFTGVAGTVSGNAFVAPSGQFTNLTTAGLSTTNGAYLNGNVTITGDMNSNGNVRAGSSHYIYWTSGPLITLGSATRLFMIGPGTVPMSRLTLGPETKGSVAFRPDTIGNGSGLHIINGDNSYKVDVALRTLSHSGNYTQELNLGTSTSSTSLSWASGNTQVVTLGAATTTFTFTPPDGPARLQLTVKQDNAGARTVVWPATVKWPAATPPTLTTSGNAVDIIAFWYNGTNYYGTSALAFG